MHCTQNKSAPDMAQASQGAFNNQAEVMKGGARAE